VSPNNMMTLVFQSVVSVQCKSNRSSCVVFPTGLFGESDVSKGCSRMFQRERIKV